MVSFGFRKPGASLWPGIRVSSSATCDDRFPQGGRLGVMSHDIAVRKKRKRQKLAIQTWTSDEETTSRPPARSTR